MTFFRRPLTLEDFRNLPAKFRVCGFLLDRRLCPLDNLRRSQLGQPSLASSEANG